jgi:hypothetical protein
MLRETALAFFVAVPACEPPTHCGCCGRSILPTERSRTVHQGRCYSAVHCQRCSTPGDWIDQGLTLIAEVTG